MVDTASKTGFISQIIGPVLDIEFPNGEKRTFLEDGDEVIMRAWCQKEGFVHIGFGECRSIILPASEYSSK